MPNRRRPDYHRLDVEFDESHPFPASGTITFQYADGTASETGTHISVPTRKVGTWRFTVAPVEPLPKGAQIAIKRVEKDFYWAWRYQDYWPDAMDYVTVEDAEGRALPFQCDTVLKSDVVALVTLPREWNAGEEVVVRLGDRRYGGPGSYVYPYVYQQARMWTGVRVSDRGPFRVAPGATLSVQTVPCPPVKRYYVLAPSTAKPAQPLHLLAMPVDVNSNVMAPGQGVEMETPDGTRVPGEVTDLSSVHTHLAIPEPGIARVTLMDPENAITTWSNPVRLAPEQPHNVYWGEFHWHGFDGSEINVLNENTDPDKAYRYGRDVTRLDFCASGSHIFRHAPQAVEEWWHLYRQAALKYDEPGRYIPFLGCEWRDREKEGGDRNLIWRDLDAPMPDPTWKIGQMYELFRGRPVMITPHVGGAIAMPYRHDPDVERLCEMTSGHGNFEWFAQAYLSKGYRLGLIGGSDGHRGTPGHPRSIQGAAGRWAGILRQRDVGYSGGPLLAVLADRLDRESLWESFRARRTYASTGARALLDFRINGALMGSEIDARTDCLIEISVEGTAPVERVDLIRDQERLMRWDGGTLLSFQERLVDRPPDGNHYYYLRVEQADGEFLWTSPIWVASSCGGAEKSLPAWNAPEEIELAYPDDKAARHLGDFLAYLEREENPEAFSDWFPYKMIDSPIGAYAVFLGQFTAADGVKRRVRVHWFYDIEMPRPRFEIGWVHYGRERIMGTAWAQPLISDMDYMGQPRNQARHQVS